MASSLSDLFPIPSRPPSNLSPFRWPGSSQESTEVLCASLAENHEKYHVYFDPRGFHNHLTHFLISLWALGADAEIINAAYKLDSAEQAPSFESPEAITAENFKDHLGDENFYTAYRKFFADLIRNKGVSTVLEEYIFDHKANFDESNKNPEMLNRFHDALFHPMIHVGYGVEFGLPGMVVEGLASTSIHKPRASEVITPSLWSHSSFSLGSVTSRLASLGANSSTSPSKNVHAFTILARILKDARFEDVEDRKDLGIFSKTIEKHHEALNKYVLEWTYNSSDPVELSRKIEELVWMNVIIYGIGGQSKNADFNADFFYMHLVTSSIFLSSLAAKLRPASQEILLRSYFVISLGWWIGRGRPNLDIAGFFASTTAYPAMSTPSNVLHEKALPSAVSPKATVPNPWFSVIHAALTVPDIHLPKTQRALAHFGSLYGTRKAGEADFKSTELEGAEILDGTLFIRVAGLTNERLSRPNLDIEGARYWDRQGFYKSPL